MSRDFSFMGGNRYPRGEEFFVSYALKYFNPVNKELLLKAVKIYCEPQSAGTYFEDDFRNDLKKFILGKIRHKWLTNTSLLMGFLLRTYIITAQAYYNFKGYSCEEASYLANTYGLRRKPLVTQNLNEIYQNKYDLILPTTYLKQLGFNGKIRNEELCNAIISLNELQKRSLEKTKLTEKHYDEINAKINDSMIDT
ncbi:hypothetical protein HYU18_04190 [Candidatus Woesearchaeota archaeon]|nr:hypothetical protein [Candidatus Woesearchaeota archaeon]